MSERNRPRFTDKDQPENQPVPANPSTPIEQMRRYFDAMQTVSLDLPSSDELAKFLYHSTQARLALEVVEALLKEQSEEEASQAPKEDYN